MKVGPYNISAIETGDFRLDGGAMFGVVPKVLWNRTNPADDLNRIRMTCRVLLLESTDRKILVDVGIGDKEGERFTDMYAVDFSRQTLSRSLASRGIRNEEITDVILSHLHFDHAGGATRRDGKIVAPAFPKAKYYVQKKHYEHALHATERDRASFFPDNYMPLFEAKVLEFTNGNQGILPGIEVIIANGHTVAMQTVRVFDERQSVWYPADLLPTSSHVPLPYIMGYDCFPLTTFEEKKVLLARAADEQWIVTYEHDPDFVATRVVRNEKTHFVRGETVEL